MRRVRNEYCSMKYEAVIGMKWKFVSIAMGKGYRTIVNGIRL
jgi:hypothetical protein